MRAKPATRLEPFACLLGALAVTWALLSAQAATLHVSRDGDDANPGAAGRPFRTIQEAVNAAGPGDTVRVGPGIYRETVVVRRSGEAGRPIAIEGTRGPDGEWLCVVDRSRPVGEWVPAPEIGLGVYKTTSLKFHPFSMTLDDKQLARVRDDFMKSGKGFEWLALPADTPCGDEMNGFDPRQRPFVKFWDAIEALYAYKDGVTYIRFRNGDDPNGMKLKAAPAAGGVKGRMAMVG